MSRCKNRILVVSEIFWPEGGGAELATYLILRILRKAGCKITVVTGTGKPALIDEVKYYYTGLLGHWNRVKRSLNTWLLTRESWFLNLLREHDVLYLPLMAYPTIPLAKKLGLRVIVHLHNFVPTRYHGVKYYFEPDKLSILEELKLGVFHEIWVNDSLPRALALPISYIVYRASRMWLEQADDIVCVSKRQAEIVEKQIPSISRRLKVVYNPPPEVPDIRKEFDSHRRLILYVGGKKHIKGYHILLKAIKRLISTFSINAHIEFILTGGGFEKLLQHSTGNVKVKILGHLSRERLIELHKYTTALIFPSICEEPLPYAVVESMLLKTVPIASRVGGIPEIVSGTKAEHFLFEPNDVNSLVAILKNVIETHPSELLEVGKNIHYHAIEKFSNVESELLNIFT